MYSSSESGRRRDFCLLVNEGKKGITSFRESTSENYPIKKKSCKDSDFVPYKLPGIFADQYSSLKSYTLCTIILG